jgi:hypothetical protein
VASVQFADRSLLIHHDGGGLLCVRRNILVRVRHHPELHLSEQHKTAAQAHPPPEAGRNSICVCTV